jgi:hypothetical protein
MEPSEKPSELCHSRCLCIAQNLGTRPVDTAIHDKEPSDGFDPHISVTAIGKSLIQSPMVPNCTGSRHIEIGIKAGDDQTIQGCYECVWSVTGLQEVTPSLSFLV